MRSVLITVVIGAGVTAGILAEASHVGAATGGVLLLALAGGGAAALAHRWWVRAGRELDRLVDDALDRDRHRHLPPGWVLPPVDSPDVKR